MAQVIIKGSLRNILLKQALLIIFTAPCFPGSFLRYYFLYPAMTHRAVTQTAWATWTFYSTPTPLSVSWPASPAKRDRSIWPIYQPARKWLSGPASLKLLGPLRNKCSRYTAHSSAVCVSLLYCLLQLLPQILPLFTFQILEILIFLSSYACSRPVYFFHSIVSWFSWFGEENSMVALTRLHLLKVSS